LGQSQSFTNSLDPNWGDEVNQIQPIHQHQKSLGTKEELYKDTEEVKGPPKDGILSGSHVSSTAPKQNGRRKLRSLMDTTKCKVKDSTSCDECAASPGCAWCLSASKCIDNMRESCQSPQDHVGQRDGSKGVCPAVDAQPTSCVLKDAKTCSECTTSPGCAWCLSANKCVDDSDSKMCSGPTDHVGQLKGSKGVPRIPSHEAKLVD
jgi:hypothetical protein